jgi:hypothetical protein
MTLTRRQFALVAATVFLPKISYATSSDNALFWHVKFPTYELILFGYARIAASFVPEVVVQGKQLIDKTQALILDMNADVTLSSIDFDRNQVAKVFPSLSSSQQKDLQVMASSRVPDKLLEKLSGFEMAALLLSEGQHAIGPSEPSIGEELINDSTTLNRPMTKLLDDNEVRSMERPLTLERVKSFGASHVSFLLDLRRRVGPIGAHLDELYKARRCAELQTLTEEIAARGIMMPPDIDQDQLRLLVVERLARLHNGTNAFTMLPIGILGGRYNILEDLKARGAEIIPIG